MAPAENIYESFQNCEKNPGHEGFFTMEEFSNFLDSLPSSYREDPIVEKLIKCQAKRTVQVIVACGDYCEVGTGFVHRVTKIDSKNDCPCDNCEESPQKVVGDLEIRTAGHVIKNNQPQSVRCRLFYDYDSDSNDVVDIFGDRLEGISSANDTISLVCVTCDVTVMESLQSCIDEYNGYYKRLKSKYLTKRTKDVATIAVVASHPHGSFKRLTSGKLTYVDVAEINQHPLAVNKETIFYDVPTCKGSSGADVLHFGGNTPPGVALIHSGSLKLTKGLNFGNFYRGDKKPQFSSFFSYLWHLLF